MGTASTAGGIRTRNLCVLNAAPLPVGLPRHVLVLLGTACAGSGSRTRNLQTLDLAPLPGWATPAWDCWTAKSGRRDSNPRTPEWRSGASCLSATAAFGGALLQGIEPCSHGRRPCCDPIASKSLCCEYPVRESNPSFRIESAVSSPIDERGRRAGPGKARGRVPFWEPGL